MNRALIALPLLAALAACADRQPPTTRLDDKPLAQPAEITLRDDLTAGKVVLLGAPVMDGRDGHRLRSEVRKADGTVEHWLDLRIHWVGAGKDHWSQARRELADGTHVPLALGPAELSVGTCSAFLWVGCDHDEQVGARLTDEMLAQAEAGEDVAVRFAMTGGRPYLVRVTAAQAKAQRARLAAWKAQR